MTKDESRFVIRIINATYPKTYYTDEIIGDAVNLWATMFAEDSFDLVRSALYTYINQEKSIAPNIGQIRAIMNRIQYPNELTEVDAWNLVQRALSNSLYGAQEEFDKLPEEVQKAIGSPQWLYHVVHDENTNMSVESSNFYRRYRKVMEERRERQSMPAAVRKVVEAIEAQQEKSAVAMLEDQRAATALDYERRRQEAVDRFLNPSPDEEIPDMQPKTFSRLQELKERLLNGRLNDQDIEHEIQPTT